jgi:hypothetical protein
MGNEASMPAASYQSDRLGGNRESSVIGKLLKEVDSFLTKRGLIGRYFTFLLYSNALQKNCDSLEIADGLSNDFKRVINEIRALIPDLSEAESKSMNSVFVIQRFSQIHNMILADESRLEKVDYRDFKNLWNSFDTDQFDFFYFAMLNWYYAGFIGSFHFKSAHVLSCCLESRHAAAKAGKNRMNLEPEDFASYLAVQDFELKFHKFRYLMQLLVVNRPSSPSPFDQITSEILKGLKDYRAMNLLPLELKNFEETKAVLDLSEKMFDELLATYEKYLESWKKIDPIWDMMKCNIEEFATWKHNHAMLRAQKLDHLASRTDDPSIKCDLIEKCVALRKEARTSYLAEKFHLQVLNEMEIAYKALDLISYRYAIYNADRLDKENGGKLVETLGEAMVDGHNYFSWINQKRKNGHQFDEDTIIRNFRIMLVNYKYNKTMFRHPQLKDNYSKSLKAMMEKYVYLKDIHLEYSSINSVEIDDDDEVAEKDKMDGGKVDEAGSDKIEFSGPNGDAE